MAHYPAFTTFPGFHFPFPAAISLESNQTLIEYFQLKFVLACLTNSSKETKQAIAEWKMIEVAMNPSLADTLCLNIPAELSFSLSLPSAPASNLKVDFPTLLSTVYAPYLKEVVKQQYPEATCFKHYFSALKRFRQKSDAPLSLDQATELLQCHYGKGCAIIQFPTTTQSWLKDSYGTVILIAGQQNQYFYTPHAFRPTLFSTSGAELKITTKNQYKVVHLPTYDTTSPTLFIDSVLKYYIPEDASRCANLLYSITDKLSHQNLLNLSRYIVKATPSSHTMRVLMFSRHDIPSIFVVHDIITPLLNCLRKPNPVKSFPCPISMLTKPADSLTLTKGAHFQIPIHSGDCFGFNCQLMDFMRVYNVTNEDLLTAQLF